MLQEVGTFRVRQTIRARGRTVRAAHVSTRCQRLLSSVEAWTRGGGPRQEVLGATRQTTG